MHSPLLCFSTCAAMVSALTSSTLASFAGLPSCTRPSAIPPCTAHGLRTTRRGTATTMHWPSAVTTSTAEIGTSTTPIVHCHTSHLHCTPHDATPRHTCARAPRPATTTPFEHYDDAQWFGAPRCGVGRLVLALLLLSPPVEVLTACLRSLCNAWCTASRFGNPPAPCPFGCGEHGGEDEEVDMHDAPPQLASASSSTAAAPQSSSAPPPPIMRPTSTSPPRSTPPQSSTASDCKLNFLIKHTSVIDHHNFDLSLLERRLAISVTGTMLNTIIMLAHFKSGQERALPSSPRSTGPSSAPTSPAASSAFSPTRSVSRRRRRLAARAPGLRQIASQLFKPSPTCRSQAACDSAPTDSGFPPPVQPSPERSSFLPEDVRRGQHHGRVHNPAPLVVRDATQRVGTRVRAVLEQIAIRSATKSAPARRGPARRHLAGERTPSTRVRAQVPRLLPPPPPAPLAAPKAPTPSSPPSAVSQTSDFDAEPIRALVNSLITVMQRHT